MSEVGHGHVDNNPTHRKVALLIAVLALLLALAETLAKGAQTSALSANIEAANLWSFFSSQDHSYDDGPYRGRSSRI